MSTVHTILTDVLPIITGLSGDGTNSGAIIAIVNRVIAAAAIVVAGFFAWKMIIHYMAGTAGGAAPADKFGGSKTKGALSEATAFMVVEGLLAAIWVLVNLGQQIVGGATGG